MNLVRAILALASAPALFAQYGGPAILARGQAPGGMQTSQIDFRPYVSVSGTYTSGLNGVALDTTGAPVSDASFGVMLGYGVSGLHSWKHTKVGLEYSGSFSHYQKSFYDGINSQTFQLSLTHQLSRHAVIEWHNSALLYGSNHATPALPQTLEFDPNTTYIPTNDFFDNRTYSISSQASLAIQRSTRLSYVLGADGFLTRRRSAALYGSTGGGAHADVQYRASRRSTVGAMYQFMHYSFTRIQGSTDAHIAAGVYSAILSRSMQFSASAGIIRYESFFVQLVPVDPAVAAIIGVTSIKQNSYQGHYSPHINARLTKVVPRGTVFVNGSHGINPGNGLFLTSMSTTAGGGYSYTGLRRWSISAGANYDRTESQGNVLVSQGNVLGTYGSYAGNVSASRQVTRFTHGVLSFTARKYDSADFRNYNKWSYAANLGLSFSPGDIPMRLW